MVQKLKKSGKSNVEIEGITGISERTIRRIEQEKPIENIDESDFRKSHPVGRPSKVTEYETLVQQWLEEPRNPTDGAIKSQEIYARLLSVGCVGGKSAVYEMVRRLRPKAPPKAIK